MADQAGADGARRDAGAGRLGCADAAAGGAAVLGVDVVTLGDRQVPAAVSGLVVVLLQFLAFLTERQLL